MGRVHFFTLGPLFEQTRLSKAMLHIKFQAVEPEEKDF